MSADYKVPQDLLEEMGVDVGECGGEVDFNDPKNVELTEDAKFIAHVEELRAKRISGNDVDTSKLKVEAIQQLDSVTRNISTLKVKMNDIFALLAAKQYSQVAGMESQIVKILTELTIDSNSSSRNCKRLINY